MFLEVLLAIDKLLILGFEANGVLSKIHSFTLQNILPEYVNLIIFPNYVSLCRYNSMGLFQVVPKIRVVSWVMSFHFSGTRLHNTTSRQLRMMIWQYSLKYRFSPKCGENTKKLLTYMIYWYLGFPTRRREEELNWFSFIFLPLVLI